MDAIKAISFGQLIQSAYEVPPSNVAPIPAGSTISGYSTLDKIIGNDLATDMNPDRGKTRVSLGLLLQDDSGNTVVAIRGTEGIWEWLHDAMFLPMPCPIKRGVGFTEDGFSTIYKSLALATKPDGDICSELASYPFPKAVRSITVCGHSLGAALATLLAFDLSVNTNFSVQAYTYASPRVGDPLFAAAYNHAVPNTYRFANRPDIVPKLPFPPMYEHVNQLIDLNPVDPENPTQSLIKFSIPCEHSLTNYLYLIGKLFGSATVPTLDPQCAPTDGGLPQGIALLR